jgi:hypothetical protein
MASRPDQFQEFVLRFASPWNLGSLTTKEWSQSFYVSGTITHSDTEAEAAAIALAGPALAFSKAHTSLVAFAYYPSGSLISTVNKTYAPGTHPGTESAYAGGGGVAQQLEVAVVMHAPVGKNSKGKEIYLRKYLHDVDAASGDPNSVAPVAGLNAILAPWNTGAGPHNVVPISAAGRGPGTWTMEQHLFTHQLRKGKKKKKAPSVSLTAEALQLVQNLLQAKGAASLAEEVLSALG